MTSICGVAPSCSIQMYPHLAAASTTTTANIDFYVSDVVYPHILKLNRCLSNKAQLFQQNMCTWCWNSAHHHSTFSLRWREISAQEFHLLCEIHYHSHTYFFSLANCRHLDWQFSVLAFGCKWNYINIWNWMLNTQMLLPTFSLARVHLFCLSAHWRAVARLKVNHRYCTWYVYGVECVCVLARVGEIEISRRKSLVISCAGNAIYLL